MIIEDKNVSGNEYMNTLKSLNVSLYKEMVEKLIGLKEGYLGGNNQLGKVVLMTKL